MEEKWDRWRWRIEEPSWYLGKVVRLFFRYCPAIADEKNKKLGHNSHCCVDKFIEVR